MFSLYNEFNHQGRLPIVNLAVDHDVDAIDGVYESFWMRRMELEIFLSAVRAQKPLKETWKDYDGILGQQA